MYGAAWTLAANASEPMTTPAATRRACALAVDDLVHRTTRERPPIGEPIASRNQCDPAAAHSNGPKTSEFSRLRRIGGTQPLQAQ
jgi:hypothetical protein